MELLPFQVEAATQIANRFAEYAMDPLAVTRTRVVPFYQNLASITGSGKTLILAETIEQMRARLPLEPIVLWLSKGRVVVWQTYANLSTGKYSDLVGGFDVKVLLECSKEAVQNSRRGLLLVATVAKFNQRDKEQGDRRIFRLGLDFADESLWDLLKKRRDERGRRRPLIVVYDEGHNLSDQQTGLLLELEPDALIAASATLRIPPALAPTIDRLRVDKGWRDEDFITSVSSTRVVEAGLVKKHIMLGGYVAPMEVCIDDLLAEMARAERTGAKVAAGFAPKAIYVSNTNAVDGVSIRDDMSRPFAQRMARPILIWRYLVETKGIDPSSVAVYSDLKFDPKHGPPAGFNLFSGGDADFDRFMAGKFRHVIFNLGLQEGWDDPACCFAYIDKEMGSPEQVTQLVGRVLRQPGARHYPAASLNTAHFYIRTDERGVFEAILDDVRAKLTSEVPEVTVAVRSSTKRGNRPALLPRKERFVPSVSIYAAAAQETIAEIVDEIIDFRGDSTNTVGSGARMQVLQTIGNDVDAQSEWVEIDHSNKVTARWIFAREIQRRRPKALGLCDIEHPKFDVMVEYNSRAADHLREQAAKVVASYIEESEIVQNAKDHPYVVGPVAVDESRLVRFKNALHDGYSDLNELEKEFAIAIDKTRKSWTRNPSAGGFSIPLLDAGKTREFRPDFIVWNDKLIFALDTKGDHLIVEDAGRKLFFVKPVEDGPELVIRLVTEGEWHNKNSEFSKVGPDGFTVWYVKQGKVRAKKCRNAAEAVEASLIS